MSCLFIFSGENDVSRNLVVRPEQKFDANFLIPLLASSSLGDTQSCSSTHQIQEERTIHENLENISIHASPNHELFERFPPDSLLKSMQIRFKSCAKMIEEEGQNVDQIKVNGQVEQNDQHPLESDQNFPCRQVIYVSEVEIKFFHLITDHINKDSRRYFGNKLFLTFIIICA